jgi:hypothetical protein
MLYAEKVTLRRKMLNEKRHEVREELRPSGTPVMEPLMAEKQFFTPLSDFVFKLIFGDHRNGLILKAFLSAEYAGAK